MKYDKLSLDRQTNEQVLALNILIVCGFVEDLLDTNSADLYSFSKKYRFDFDFENKFTKAWIN